MGVYLNSNSNHKEDYSESQLTSSSNLVPDCSDKHSQRKSVLAQHFLGNNNLSNKWVAEEVAFSGIKLHHKLQQDYLVQLQPNHQVDFSEINHHNNSHLVCLVNQVVRDLVSVNNHKLQQEDFLVNLRSTCRWDSEVVVFLANSKLNSSQAEGCLVKQNQQEDFSDNHSSNKLSRKEVSSINHQLLLQACLDKLEINQSQVHFFSQQDKDS